MSRARGPAPAGQTMRSLFRGVGVSVEEIRCRAGAGRERTEEESPGHGIALVRRGLFRYASRGRACLADANSVLFFNAGQVGRYEHPLDAGDDCTILRLEARPALAAVASFAPRDAERPDRPFRFASALATPRAARLHFELLAALRGVPPPLGVDDLLADLVGEALAAAYARLSHAGVARFPSRRGREAVEEVKGVLSARLHAPPRLAELAASVGLSPFHLSRTFRAETGISLRRYLQRLRAGLAADRLARGERDLSALALDLGFSDHSHFTGAFRREWGEPPSRLRALHAGARSPGPRPRGGARRDA